VLSYPRQFVALRAAFPQYLDKVAMLGALLSPRKAFIDDPYQRSVAETEQIAAQVESALGELAKLLGLPPRSEVDEPMRPPPMSCPTIRVAARASCGAQQIVTRDESADGGAPPSPR